MTLPHYDLLKPFFDALLSVKTPIASGRLISDMGLIIYDVPEILQEEVVRRLPGGVHASNIILGESNDSAVFLSAITEASEKGNWIFALLSGDPTSALIGIVKEIGETGLFQQNGKEIDLHKDTRIIFLVKDEILEKKITYPYFMEMFGPIVRI